MTNHCSLAAAALGLMLATPTPPSEGPASTQRTHPSTLDAAVSAHRQLRADSVLGVFEGRTPCGAVALDFTGFPRQGCEKIKWRLTLYRDPATGRPTTFLYDGTRSTRRGRWSIEASTQGRPGYHVYRLHYESPGTKLMLLSVDDQVLLLLDGEQKVLVGDASWSYALNRVASRPRSAGATGGGL